MSDLIILGGGPAGVSAALYAVRAGLNVVLVENGASSLSAARQIENYYGNVVNGPQLYANGLAQAAALGVKIIHDEAVAVSEKVDGFGLKLQSEQELRAPALILATGSKKKSLNLPKLKDFIGKGVSYCAVCDGFFFRSKHVGVLGNGAYALHEAAYLAKLATTVTIFTNGEDANQLTGCTFPIKTAAITTLKGEMRLEKIFLANGEQLLLDGLFIALGTADSGDFARALGAEVSNGFVKIATDGATTIPGLFAAGDATGGLLQIAKAVSEGAHAGLAAVRYCRSLKN